ncbi:MAG: HD domain-containing phosphohydrolase, partial [Gammaproteobacteria bacterium]
MDIKTTDLPKLLGELNAIGIALSAEKDHNRLLEMILVRAMEITNADGGTLYTRGEDNKLKFEIMHTKSLNIHRGAGGDTIPLNPVPLYEGDGSPNRHNVAACAVLDRKTINIPDAYSNTDFDFSGTRKFDRMTGYRSQSFLTVPMTNHENTIIGVLQLINAQVPETKAVIPFSFLAQQLVESLASQAAVTITNKSLIDAQKALFDALIKLVADAIDEKSPYTGGHCRRVPIITNLLAKAACKVDYGPLQGFTMTEEEIYELDVAAWLHDCGKITTPEFVVDKGTKLETIFDKIHMIDMRFEVLKRDAEIAALSRKLAALGVTEFTDGELHTEITQLDSDREFLRGCNIGSEFISDEAVRRIDQIAGRKWRTPAGMETALLNDEEMVNLKISRGTLNDKERQIINNHVSTTIKILQSLPYPKHLTRVTEYAGGHHEKMDGTGYPNRLKGEQMSIPARMVAIADVFEALTAKDRPYKKAMPLSKALTILGRLKLENHIDPDLFDVFVWEQVYL